MTAKALIVAPTYPYPIDGGNLVALHGYHVALRHAGMDEVHFMGFEDPGHMGGDQFEAVTLLPKPPKVSAMGALRFAWGQSILFSRYHSAAFTMALKQALARHPYKVVLFQHAYLGQYLGKVLNELAPGCLKVASAEVLESRAFLKKAELNANPLLKLAFQRESRLLDAQETQVFDLFDRVTFFSEEDKQHYRSQGGRAEAHVVNLGIEVDRYPVIAPRESDGETLRVAFFGAFSWFANTDALDYLLNDVWPVVEAQAPRVELLIAGRDIPEWAYQRASDRLKVVGRVESIAGFLEGVDVVLSPIRIGGGIRLKILESLAYGRLVLSTRVGLEGLDPRVLPEVQAVDTPQEYANALRALSEQGHKLSDKARQASELVRSIYDARHLAPLFVA